MLSLFILSTEYKRIDFIPEKVLYLFLTWARYLFFSLSPRGIIHLKEEVIFKKQEIRKEWNCKVKLVLEFEMR